MEPSDQDDYTDQNLDDENLVSKFAASSFGTQEPVHKKVQHKNKNKYNKTNGLKCCPPGLQVCNSTSFTPSSYVSRGIQAEPAGKKNERYLGYKTAKANNVKSMAFPKSILTKKDHRSISGSLTDETGSVRSILKNKTGVTYNDKNVLGKSRRKRLRSPPPRKTMKIKDSIQFQYPRPASCYNRKDFKGVHVSLNTGANVHVSRMKKRRRRRSQLHSRRRNRKGKVASAFKLARKYKGAFNRRHKKVIKNKDCLRNKDIDPKKALGTIANKTKELFNRQMNKTSFKDLDRSIFGRLKQQTKDKICQPKNVEPEIRVPQSKQIMKTKLPKHRTRKNSQQDTVFHPSDPLITHNYNSSSCSDDKGHKQKIRACKPLVCSSDTSFQKEVFSKKLGAKSHQIELILSKKPPKPDKGSVCDNLYPESCSDLESNARKKTQDQQFMCPKSVSQLKAILLECLSSCGNDSEGSVTEDDSLDKENSRFRQSNKSVRKYDRHKSNNIRNSSEFSSDSLKSLQYYPSQNDLQPYLPITNLHHQSSTDTANSSRKSLSYLESHGDRRGWSKKKHRQRLKDPCKIPPFKSPTRHKSSQEASTSDSRMTDSNHLSLDEINPFADGRSQVASYVGNSRNSSFSHDYQNKQKHGSYLKIPSRRSSQVESGIISPEHRPSHHPSSPTRTKNVREISYSRQNPMTDTRVSASVYDPSNKLANPSKLKQSKFITTPDGDRLILNRIVTVEKNLKFICENQPNKIMKSDILSKRYKTSESLVPGCPVSKYLGNSGENSYDPLKDLSMFGVEDIGLIEKMVRTTVATMIDCDDKKYDSLEEGSQTSGSSSKSNRKSYVITIVNDKK